MGSYEGAIHGGIWFISVNNDKSLIKKNDSELVLEIKDTIFDLSNVSIPYDDDASSTVVM